MRQYIEGREPKEARREIIDESMRGKGRNSARTRKKEEKYRMQYYAESGELESQSMVK